MKANKKTTEPTFKPLVLELTIESQEEYDFLLNLFGNSTDESLTHLAKRPYPEKCDVGLIIYRGLELLKP